MIDLSEIMKIKFSIFVAINIILQTQNFTFPSNKSIYFQNIVNISKDSTDEIIVVDKSKQYLFVVKSYLDSPLAFVDSFRVTTGKNNGNKEREGDNKTPEGIYRIIGSIPGNQLPPLYGPIAYILDYPNFVDRIYGRTGSNIWIHGRDKEITNYQTKGCISLHNHSILRLSKYIKLNKTLVLIQDTIHIVNEEKYQNITNNWNKYLSSWAESWEKDTASYFRYYSDKFRTKKFHNFKQFKKYKRYLERIYNWKHIEIGEALVYQTKYETQAEFYQEFICPKFYSTGIKTIRMIPEENGWKIVNEDFSPIEPQVYIKDIVNKFVKEWIAAWESKDIEKYITFYDTSFKAGEMNLNEWYNYKKRIFEKARRIDISATNLNIVSPEKFIWKVTFIQRYKSKSYSDIGRKILILKGKPNSFKIIEEKWERIK